jgi:hypothetical protein
MAVEIEFAINMHTQILNTVCSLYKEMSMSKPRIQNFHLSGKRYGHDIAEIRLHIKFA